MASNMMDTQPGGESTQYESIQTVTKPHAKENTSLPEASTSTEASQAQSTANKERGEQTAENIRFGESISEHGFGGETTTQSGGGAGQSGAYGRTETGGDEKLEQGRAEQGYGGGSGVGG
ncbi:MAG: hypothetical protein M1817_002773 [Caeruleum heppii]|nr:MAG: hypothetical protein M1817_002773 [Caeruleum heppii]